MEVNGPKKYSGKNAMESVDYLQQYRQKKADEAEREAEKELKRVSIFSRSKTSRINTGRLTITGIAKNKRAKSISSNRSGRKAPKKTAMHDYIVEDRRETELSKPAAAANRSHTNRSHMRVTDEEQELAEWHKNDNNDGSGRPAHEASFVKEGEPFHSAGKDGNKRNDGSDEGSTDEQDGRNENDNRREVNDVNDSCEDDNEENENGDGEDVENCVNDSDDSEITISWSTDGTDVDEANYEDEDENKFLDPD